MNAEQTSNTAAQSDIPAGYEPREVVWPGTEERMMALFPVQTDDAE
jgi:hypothetical protein